MAKKIISVITKDRPGLIAAVSHILLENDCNIENISQTILQTEFAGIFLVSAPDNLEKENLRDQIRSTLNDPELSLNIKNINDETQTESTGKTDPFIITTIGPDKKGLVAAFSKIIAGFNANITDLKAVFEGGADPNRNFMIYEVDIPNNTNHSDMINVLRKNADLLGLKVSVQHRNIFKSINKI